MSYCFENSNAKGFRGRPRTTIVTTLNNDIKRSKVQVPLFSVRTLKSSENLERVRHLAQDRVEWRNMVSVVHSVAEDEKWH